MTAPPDLPWQARPPYLQRWIDSRNGRERVYFRKGSTRVEMTKPWGTQALADEAAFALSRVKVRPPPTIGTLVGAVKAYRGDRASGVPSSADYLSLSPATQCRYDRWCDEFERLFDGVLLADVDAAYILELRNGWAPRGHEAANSALQVLKNVCKPAMITQEIEGNPFELISKVARPQGLGIRNPRWEDAEVDAVIEDALARGAPGFARAIALGRWGGFRKQTICSVPLRARIERRNAAGATERRIYWLTEKREILCDRREDMRLTELLSKTPNRALTIAYNSDGNPWKGRQLSTALERVLHRLTRRGLVRSRLTMHGLRHARGVEIALLGGSDAEIQVALDHASPRAAQGYRKQADRLRLGDTMQGRVDAEVIRLRGLAERRRQSGDG